MARKYTKVLALMQSKPDGKVSVNDPDLVTLLGPVYPRLACYMSDIRTYGKLEVAGIREGRKVVAYQLVAVAPAAADANTATLDASTTPTVNV